MNAAILVGLLVSGAVIVQPRPAHRGRSGAIRLPKRTGADDRGGRPERREFGPRGVGRPNTEQVASALVLLALGYRSGLPTWQVLTTVAERSPELVARDLRQVAAALQWGAPDAEAWGSVDPSWAPAARAVAIAHHAGVPPGPLLLTAADDLRRSELERLEIAAARIGVRLVAPLGLVLLPAFCLTTVVPLVVALGGQLLGTE